MNTLDLLYDALDDKIQMQIYYNESMLRIVNPAARQLFSNLRDEETRHIQAIQQEIAAIEAKPFPINKILPGMKSQTHFEA